MQPTSSFLHDPLTGLISIIECVLAQCFKIVCFNMSITAGGGPRWCSWLRHCATSQKVMGSIPDGVIGIFH